MTAELSEPVEWTRQTVIELRTRVADGAVGLWALGATEQHGAHLVTGFDHLAAEAIVCAAASELGDAALVLPTFSLGCSSYWVDMGGTLSLREDTLRRVILDVCRSVAAAGLQNLVIVNGHSGNIGVGIASVNEFGAGDTLVEFVSYWSLIDRAQVLEIMDVEDGFGHAGQFETAIGMHLDGIVRHDCVPVPDVPLDPSAPGGSAVVFHHAPSPERDTRDGVIGDAGSASPEVGAAVIRMATAGLVQHCQALRGRRLVSPVRQDGRDGV